MLTQYIAGGYAQITCIYRKLKTFFRIRKHLKRFFHTVVQQPSFLRQLYSL